MCFSPPVMLATLVLEFGLAIYVAWRYKSSAISRLVFAILVCLGTFQLAEYMICGGLGLGHIEWAKTGYVAITLLPALGLHLVATIAKKDAKPLIFLAYGTALAYVLYFLAASGSVIARECAPNYAIFDVHGAGALLYGVYYYGWLLVTIGCAAVWADKTPKVASALRWTVIGYGAFIVPTTFVNMVDPSTIAAIPSIMCGFAFILAAILVGRVLPLTKAPTVRSKKKSAPTKKRRS